MKADVIDPISKYLGQYKEIKVPFFFFPIYYHIGKN